MRIPHFRGVKMDIYFNKRCRTTGKSFGKDNILSMPHIAS